MRKYLIAIIIFGLFVVGCEETSLQASVSSLVAIASAFWSDATGKTFTSQSAPITVISIYDPNIDLQPDQNTYSGAPGTELTIKFTSTNNGYDTAKSFTVSLPITSNSSFKSGSVTIDGITVSSSDITVSPTSILVKVPDTPKGVSRKITYVLIVK